MNVRSLYLLAIALLISCDRLLIGPDPDNTDTGCFNIFWNNYDQHYPSFIIKNIDWDSVYNTEMSKINQKGLYDILTDVGKALKDNHFQVTTSDRRYIESPFTWANRVSNSPVNVIRYLSLKSIDFGIVKYGTFNNIGYIAIKSFGSEEQVYDEVVSLIKDKFKDCDGIIIDIRDNSGGNRKNGDKIAALFTDRKILCYTLQYRNGPAHSDFGKEIEHYISPSGGFHFNRPVAVLTNKRCGSAAEMFCLGMRIMPNSFIVGDTTSGTLSDNVLQELPNGWIYRMPTAYLTTPGNEIFEGKGIPPDYPVWISQEDSVQGRDLIFEKAVEIVENKK